MRKKAIHLPKEKAIKVKSAALKKLTSNVKKETAPKTAKFSMGKMKSTKDSMPASERMKSIKPVSELNPANIQAMVNQIRSKIKKRVRSKKG